MLIAKQKVIKAYTRPTASYHITGVRKKVKSVAAQQIAVEQPKGWHRMLNRVLAY
jgi:hypothetical protein